MDEMCVDIVVDVLFGLDIEVCVGVVVIEDVVRCFVDCLLVVIVGINGLLFMVVVVEVGNLIVLVNKESMVCVGLFLNWMVNEWNVVIVLIDLEYNVMF